MKKKLVTRLCAVAMAVAMVGTMVGCGDGDTPADSNNSTPDTEQGSDNQQGGDDQQGDDQQGEDQADAQTYDFGGAVVRVSGGIWGDLNPDNEGNPNYLEKMDLLTKLEAKYNIDVEYVKLEGDDGRNTADLILAAFTSGESYADLFCPSDDVTVKVRDYLVDISSFKDELQMGSIYLEPCTWFGKTYGFTYDNMGSVYVMCYSRDYLKNIGMTETPTEKFLKGEWSYEDCKAYFTELEAKLPDGTYPIAVHSNHWVSMAPAANGTLSVDSNGGIHLADDAYVEALGFYQDLMNSGLAAPMIEVIRNEDGTFEDVTEPYGMDNMSTATEGRGYVLTMVEAWQMSYLESTLAGEWGIVPWPWGSQVTCTPGEEGYKTLSENYHTAQSIWTNMVAAQKDYRGAGAKEIPDNVLFQIARDWCDLCSENGAKARYAMWEAEKNGEDYENLGYEPGKQGNFSTMEDAALYDWLHSRVVVDWAHAVSSYVKTNMNGYYVIAGGDDPRTAGESFKSEGEAKLKEAFGN